MGLTVYGGGGKPEEEKTVTAGTSAIVVNPSSGKVMKKVTVNPTPTEEKTITAGTSATTVTPASGKYIKKVTVNPTPSQSKTVTPSTSQQTVSPDSGKLLSQVIVKAMEDVTPEVTAQTPIITHIAENLGVTITTPSGTNKQILQGNNANLLNIKNNAKKEGLYVWKKLTAQGGDFVDFVVSDSESAYPYGGEQGGYWYELYGLPLKIVTWANGTDEEIVAMVEAADQGLINLSDYWAVGDIRTVQLSAMSATGVGESHAAQQVDLVLMHAGGYDLNAAVASGRTKCSFVVGLKDSLAETGYMNSSTTNSGSWNGSARRTWCNNVFRNAIPSTLRAIFKQFKTVTAETYNGSTNQTSVDYFALPSEREIFGARTYCNQTEYIALFQFDYYKTKSNRVKKLGKTGKSSGWWERSPWYKDSACFCGVLSDGSANYFYPSYAYGLAPFGCI